MGETVPPLPFPFLSIFLSLFPFPTFLLLLESSFVSSQILSAWAFCPVRGWGWERQEGHMKDEEHKERETKSGRA